MNTSNATKPMVKLMPILIHMFFLDNHEICNPFTITRMIATGGESELEEIINVDNKPAIKERFIFSALSPSQIK